MVLFLQLGREGKRRGKSKDFIEYSRKRSISITYFKTAFSESFSECRKIIISPPDYVYVKLMQLEFVERENNLPYPCYS